jgi:ribosomal-protein-alanine N-acetyltransferase
MKKLPITELEGMRILLVPLNESHIPAMFEYSSMPEFYIHMESLPHKSIEETAKYFSRLQNFINEGALYWAIIKKDINKTIGTVGIRNINHQALSGELGLGISPLFWNMGFAKETDTLVIDYFFNRLNYQKIISYTSIDNHGAVKTWNFMGYDHYTTVNNYYKKYDGSSYDALRAELNRTNFNGNPLFKDFKKSKKLYDK